MTKTLIKRMFIAMMVLAVSIVPCFATTEASKQAQSFGDIVAPIIDLLNSLLGPMILVVGAVGALYCVILGVKYARAEEPQDREKAKAHLKGAIIGFVLIFVLIVVLNLSLPYLSTWAAQYQSGTIPVTSGSAIK